MKTSASMTITITGMEHSSALVIWRTFSDRQSRFDISDDGLYTVELPASHFTLQMTTEYIRIIRGGIICRIDHDHYKQVTIH